MYTVLARFLYIGVIFTQILTYLIVRGTYTYWHDARMLGLPRIIGLFIPYL